MKKLLTTSAIAILLAGNMHTNVAYAQGGGHMLGALLGAAGGAVAGANIGKGKGRTVAIAVGTLLGAGIGGSVGRSVDHGRPNRHHHGHAASYPTVSYAQPAPVGYYSSSTVSAYQPVVYQQASVVTQTVNQNVSYQPYCREFTQRITVGGKIQESYGTACLQPDGAWEIQK